MKRMLCCGILAASVVAACEYRAANQSVYHLSISSAGQTFDPLFQFGSPPHNIGVCMRTSVGWVPNFLKPEDVKTWTDFEIAGHVFTMRGDASPWLRAAGHAGTALILATFLSLLTTPKSSNANND
jgi:hypothetical protein